MAFKRSAVRSRLSPPTKNLGNLVFPRFFHFQRKLPGAKGKLAGHILDHIGPFLLPKKFGISCEICGVSAVCIDIEFDKHYNENESGT